jgi:hypothetical protein
VHQIAGELRRADEIRAEREAAAAELSSGEEIRAERPVKQANEHTTAAHLPSKAKKEAAKAAKMEAAN